MTLASGRSSVTAVLGKTSADLCFFIPVRVSLVYWLANVEIGPRSWGRCAATSNQPPGLGLAIAPGQLTDLQLFDLLGKGLHRHSCVPLTQAAAVTFVCYAFNWTLGTVVRWRSPAVTGSTSSLLAWMSNDHPAC